MMITRLHLPASDPTEFLCKLGAKEKHPVLVQWGRFTIIGWNPSRFLRFYSVSDARASLNALAKKRRKKYDGPLPFAGGIIGYVSGDAGYELLDIDATAVRSDRLPVVCAGIYDDALLFDGECVLAVGSKRFAAEATRIAARKMPKRSVSPLRFRASVSFNEYAERFRRVQKLIRDGVVYQLNLTHTYDAVSPAEPREVFSALVQAHPALCAAYLDCGDHRLLSLSPERFLEVNGHVLATFPVKGTRPRGNTAGEDMRLRKELLESPKEAAELNMITDLLRNDIGRIAKTGSVRVSEHRRIDGMKSVWHTSSVIEAELDRQHSPLDALFSMLPAGSVTGCPKKQACIEIDRLENVKRGPYTGAIFALSDHGDLRSSVIIRTLVHSGKKFSLGVGGGIVADSEVAKEWAETLQKASPFLRIRKPKNNVYRPVFINGRPARADDVRLHALDPSNPKTFGAFETMRSRSGVIADLPAHIKRMAESAKLLGLVLPDSIRNISADLKRVALSSKERCRIKVVCTGKDVIISSEPLRRERDDDGISAMFVRCDRLVPKAKALPFHCEYAAHDRARSLGFGEALLLRSSGTVPESAYGNIFWVSRGVLHTSAKNMLPGITRAWILHQSSDACARVRFFEAQKRDLLAADEVFITNSVRGIVPVVRIEKTLIGSGKPGPLTRSFMQKFQAL